MRTSSLALGISFGALVTACGSDDTANQQGSGGTSGAGGSGAGSAYLLPQFVRGAAAVNPEAFPSIDIVVEGATAPTSATLDGAALTVTADGARWLAAATTTALSEGEHALEVTGPAGSASGKLVVAPGSVQHTEYEDVGAASYSNLVHDVASDRLLLSWADYRGGGSKHAYLESLDGAGRSLGAPVRLDPESASAVRVQTAFGPGHVAALYNENKDFQGNPGTRLSLRVLDLAGVEVVAPIELNPATPGTLGTQPAVAWDGAGFDVVWADFELPSVTKKIYWLRVDPATGATTGPIAILDGTYDAATSEGKIDDLQALSLACNASTCAVAYRRQEYNALVELSAAKVRVATVATASGAAGADVGLLLGDWDIQEDPTITAASDGRFVVSFAGTDTEAVLNTPDPCDESGRQKIYLALLDANGAPAGALAVINDEVGQRFQAASAWHPEGAAMLWEDQREKCTDLLHGQNRLAIAFARSGVAEAPYLALPRTRLVAESWISAAPLGPNYAFAWTDERQGGSVLEAKGEIFVDTYWRK